MGPPPTHSSPRKQRSKRSPESGSRAGDPTSLYRSGGLPKSTECSSNTESESFGIGAIIYNSAKTFPRSEPQPKLCRDVYAASENIRPDRNRIEGIENPYHIRIDDLMNELAPHPEELDDLSYRILGDFSRAYYGREHHLARL